MNPITYLKYRLWLRKIKYMFGSSVLSDSYYNQVPEYKDSKSMICRECQQLVAHKNDCSFNKHYKFLGLLWREKL
jgi:hypothetical protein